MRSTPLLATLAAAFFLLGSDLQAADDAPAPAPAAESKLAKWHSDAEKGEPWACFNLGLAYHLGRDAERNSLEAIRWYKAAADRGYAPAQVNLGYCYDAGFGVPTDPAEAAKWYQAAAVQGNAFAQYNLGKKYMSGPGVPLDPKLALKWLSQAAQQNFIPAYFSLGQIYANDLQGNHDYKEAHKWFRLAAEQGYAPAQHAIGYLHFEGKGVPQSYPEAVKWYNMAASRNFADSHYNLAICYERGLGVPQNAITAVNHYRTAAELGHPQAQYSLGVAYYEGKGTDADFVQAYKWWNLAAVQGIPEASTSRDILIRLMNEKQIKEGQRLAGEFKARPATASDGVRMLQTAAAEGSEAKKIGTGFFITSDGYFLTGFKNIAGANSLQLITESGTFQAKLVKTDQLNGIALLKAEGSFHPLTLASSREVTTDTEITAVGFDGNQQVSFDPKIARGKITSLLGFQADPRQFSFEPRVSVSFGGSALITKQGQVVGMMLSDLEQSLPPDVREKLKPITSYAVKSDHLISFLRTVGDIKYKLEDSKRPDAPAASDINSPVRAATALVLIL